MSYENFWKLIDDDCSYIWNKIEYVCIKSVFTKQLHSELMKVTNNLNDWTPYVNEWYLKYIVFANINNIRKPHDNQLKVRFILLLCCIYEEKNKLPYIQTYNELLSKYPQFINMECFNNFKTINKYYKDITKQEEKIYLVRFYNALLICSYIVQPSRVLYIDIGSIMEKSKRKCIFANKPSQSTARRIKIYEIFCNKLHINPSASPTTVSTILFDDIVMNNKNEKRKKNETMDDLPIILKKACQIMENKEEYNFGDNLVYVFDENDNLYYEE